MVPPASLHSPLRLSHSPPRPSAPLCPQEKINQMNNMMANGDVFQLMFFLRGGISRNQVPSIYMYM